MKKAELLLPAGNLEKLKMVLHYGADACYLGGEQFSLRALSDNFNNEELLEAVKYAHNLNKKVYCALNIIPHNEDLNNLPEFVKFLESAGIDGVIVADLGVFAIVKENSNLQISVSTQASNTNWRSVKMWHQMGAKRVVLAREVSLDEIREIREKVPEIEIEVFIHGAMCISISGRCLMSNYMTGRDANRGNCAHPCRWKYHLMEEKRPGEYFPIYEDEQGTFIFDSKDLCSITFIDKLLDIGVDSLKIEGRMKGMYYAAICAKVYKEALDSYYSGNYKYKDEWLTELESISHRNYISGFYLDKPDANSQNYAQTSYKQSHLFVAKVVGKLPENEYILEVRNRMVQGETIEVVTPYKKNVETILGEMYNNETGEKMEAANPNSTVRVKFEFPIEEMDIIRKRDNRA